MVIALASRPVANGDGVLLAGELDEFFCDQRAGQRVAEQSGAIDADAGLQAGQDIVVGKTVLFVEEI